MGAFRALAKANHHPRLYEMADEFHQAVADIQLFGTPDQVMMARRFASELGTHQAANIDALLVTLRDNLRSELGAVAISEGFLWLRVEEPKDRAQAKAPARRN